MSNKTIAIISGIFFVLAWSALIVDIFNLAPLYSKIVFYVFAILTSGNCFIELLKYYRMNKE